MSMTPEEALEYIESAPMPCEGPKPWDQYTGDKGYETAALCLARAMLITVCDVKKETGLDLLDTRIESDDDPSGWDAANNDKLMTALNGRFPDIMEWLGGPTGFQWGWAHGIVRYALGHEPVGNPAIVEMG